MKTFREIALGFAIISLLFSSKVFIASAADLSSVVSQPFGGFVTAFIPANPICPVSHTVIFDLSSKTIMGLAVVPGSIVYRNYDVVKTGTALLGSFIRTPIPCLVPYPVYPFGMVGTS